MSAALGPILKIAKMVPPKTIVNLMGRVNPKAKNFLSNALAYGYTIDQALDYMGEKFQGDASKELQEKGPESRPEELAAKSDVEASQMPAKVGKTLASYALPGISAIGEEAPTQETNPIRDASPGLDRFLREKIEAGVPLEEAANLAKAPQRKFVPTIKDLTRSLNREWKKLVRDVYQPFEVKGTPSRRKGKKEAVREDPLAQFANFPTTMRQAAEEQESLPPQQMGQEAQGPPQTAQIDPRLIQAIQQFLR